MSCALVDLSTPSPGSLRRASRVVHLTYDVGDGPSGARPGAALQRLQTVLGKLAGDAGAHSLVARAMVLARTGRSVAVIAGPSSEAVLNRPADGTDAPDLFHRSAAEVRVIACVLELLDIFIGEQLTLQLIKEAWPAFTTEPDVDLKDPHP